MKKKKKNDWDNSTVGLIIFTIALFMLIFDYNVTVYDESVSTGSKTIRGILQILDKKFGQESVYFVVILGIVISGYTKLNSSPKKEEDDDKEE